MTPRAPASIQALTLALGFLACSPAEPVKEIAERRTASVPSSPVRTGAGPSERFQMDMGPAEESPVDLADVFRYDLPEGWDVLPPTGERLVHLRPAGDAQSSCYLSFLGGSAGGLEANVNRWLAQFGAEPLTGAEIAALPRRPVLGREATLVEVEGTFKGMGGEVERADHKLLGLAVSEPEGSLFVKFTGPASLVDGERARFLDFAASLRVAEAHGGHAPEAQGSESAGPVGAGGKLSWVAPPGWSELPARPMREVTFGLGGEGQEAAECYVTRLSGSAGGLVPNLDRWCDQFGRGPLSPEELDGLERVEVLGLSVPVLELSGRFEGMDGIAQEGQGLLGVACVRPEESFFVKLVGSQSVVHAERANFLAFVASLEEER